jgi:hypothetical protein
MINLKPLVISNSEFFKKQCGDKYNKEQEHAIQDLEPFLKLVS